MSEKKSIEELAEKNGVDTAILEAVKIDKKWGIGKTVTETVFKKAVKDFLNAPSDGRKKPEKAEAVSTSKNGKEA